jgi:hypothetical protein
VQALRGSQSSPRGTTQQLQEIQEQPRSPLSPGGEQAAIELVAFTNKTTLSATTTTQPQPQLQPQPQTPTTTSLAPKPRFIPQSEKRQSVLQCLQDKGEQAEEKLLSHFTELYGVQPEAVLTWLRVLRTDGYVLDHVKGSQRYWYSRN